MKCFSLFSGVGGFEIGLPKDWEIVGFSEIDKYASQVLKYHYPNVKNYGDITKIRTEDLPDFDLLTGGSPCQDLSIAGKRRGLAGTRSGLFLEYIRILCDKKPRYFIWENVKGALSSNYGFDFAVVLNEFSEAGYSLWWQVLNAKDFGVPQNRERIFVVGFREGSPKEVFFESKDSGQIEVLGTTKGEENTRIGERDMVYGGGGIMGGLKATDYKQPPQILVEGNYGTGKYNQSRQIYNQDGISPTLTAEMGEGGGIVPTIKVVNKGESQHYRLYDIDGLAPTLQSQSGMSSQKHPFIEMKIANCLTPDAYLATGKRKRVNDKAVLTSMHERRVRKLMPIECERLMSWPDNHTKYGVDDKGNKIEISDSQRYRQCGNGVVSNVIKELMKNLILAPLPKE